jgi:hypothetical protein
MVGHELCLKRTLVVVHLLYHMCGVGDSRIQHKSKHLQPYQEVNVRPARTTVPLLIPCIGEHMKPRVRTRLIFTI